MIISVVILGYEDLAKDFIVKFKSLTYYKKRDSDSEGVRISSVHVENADLLDAEYVYRYEISEQKGFANVLSDGDQETSREVNIGNDSTWLLGSDGHDTVFEAVDDLENYFDTLLELIRKSGHLIFLTSNYSEEQKAKISEAAEENNATVIFESNLESIMETLDTRYSERLLAHRRQLLEESLSATPCGIPDVE